MATSDELKASLYSQRLKVSKLRREVFGQENPPDESLDALGQEEAALAALEAQFAQATRGDAGAGRLVQASISQAGAGGVLGVGTTNLTADVRLRMKQVPTAIYHLFDPEETPLITVFVQNLDTKIRRLRVRSFIQGYSADAVSTWEIPARGSKEFNQLPTLFPDSISDLTELTRATLNVQVEDIEKNFTESHSTHPIWLLSINTAPLAVQDPKAGANKDLTPYLGAFVTPNVRPLMRFLSKAVELHPDKRLVGYQFNDRSLVAPQVEALFKALKDDARMHYVNSVIDFTPEQGSANQRVRRPRESLEDGQANCLDGTVLFASLLEAISLNPALVIVPGHAFVAWETWPASGEWKFLETTLIDKAGFAQACQEGEKLAARYRALFAKTQNPEHFRLWPLVELRSKRGITPLE